ncbi:MAG TPA: metal ABC transporter ATP-binding protein, partial [Longimicrobiales bacterium]|nr:metal ABC transporter ATP-binding protein [Longimicrobiales bacterium]
MSDAASAPAVVFDDVWFGYGHAEVLRGIDFVVPHGSFTALIGPNGAGKTTMLRLMLGLLKPKRGRVRMFGEEPGGRIVGTGYVPQRTGVPDNFPLSTLDVVLMGRYGHIGWVKRPTDADRDVARRALERVGLGAQADRRFGDLSGGQQRRALIARALVGDPRVLLLDEPTAGLDPGAQLNFYDMCCDLQREERMTVIAASHDVEVVGVHADNVILIDGDVVAAGPPKDVLTDEVL